MELKPCPFCGCTEITADHDYSWGWDVHCIGCYATIEDCMTKEEAIAKWNKRVRP